MNIIIWGVRIIEDSDSRGSDNRGCTVHACYKMFLLFLPARASEQGNVIGSMSMYIYIYIYMSSKKIVIERSRDLIYLKFVATDFSPKIISPSASENSGDLA